MRLLAFPQFSAQWCAMRVKLGTKFPKTLHKPKNDPGSVVPLGASICGLHRWCVLGLKVVQGKYHDPRF